MRDLHVPPIVFIGCIAPAFLCLLGISLGYIYLNLPLWIHAPEFNAALERYERISEAVFQSEESPDALAGIAVEPQLSQLQKDLDAQLDEPFPKIYSQIAVAAVLELTDTCAMVTIEQDDTAFILDKVDQIWKVRFVTPNYRAGVAGGLPLHAC